MQGTSTTEAYLDNSATTRPFDEVCAHVDELNRTIYGNPSSLHRMGMQAEAVIKQAKAALLCALPGSNGSIVLTSGGTEADNLAILGSTLRKAKRAPRVITTQMEHPAVAEPMKQLQAQGAELVLLKADANGQDSPQQLRELLTPNTVLVSVMAVNNEVGSIQPIAALGKLIHQTVPGCLFHVDAVQAFGKIPLAVRDIDLLTVSGHKINGPKGIGALYVRQGVHLEPIVFGGHQEKNLRSGTENVPAIGGLRVAVEKTMAEFAQHTAELSRLRCRLMDGLSGIPGIIFHSKADAGFAPHIVNVSFPGIRSEVMLHTLEADGVYVSSGSACSSNHPSPSPTLSAMGVPREQIDSAIRFSLGYFVTEEQIDYAINCVKRAAKQLRLP